MGVERSTHRRMIRADVGVPHPDEVVRVCLEYGTDSLEIHVDAISENARVVIADDLIATGGTAAATAQLVSKLGGQVVECAFVIELSFLNGRSKLQPYGVFSVVQYDAE